MGFRLIWKEDNLGEDGHRVYRSSSPMDPQALPAPVVELGPDVTQYDDGGVVEGNTYYYRVSAFLNTGAEKVSEEISVVADASTDPFYASVASLMYFGQEPFVDEKGLSWTNNNGVSRDPGEGMSGDGSARFSAGKWLSRPSHPELTIENQDFTVEFHIKLVSTTQQTVFSNNNQTATGHLLRVTAGAGLLFGMLGKSPNITTATGVLSTSIFKHVAVCRDATSTRIYVDGVLEAEGVHPNGAIGSSATFTIGRYGTATDYLNAYLDNWRVTVGVARYTANFIPPNAPFPNI